MSTRASIYYKKPDGNVHLYKEMLDGVIHLEVSGKDCSFVAGNGFYDIELLEDAMAAIAKHWNERAK